MNNTEIPLVFNCQSTKLIGILHQPEKPAHLGVLIVVGGPQYRAGSHRQFVLLARSLAANDIPVVRFDYRGMGDSLGSMRSFAEVDEDIRSAVDLFFHHSVNLTGVVIWGLCDAASAASFYAYQDTRVKGLVLLNPWLFTEQGAAKTYLKHYYLQRLTNPDLWRKVFSFQFNYRQSFSSLLLLLKNILGSSKNNIKKSNSPDSFALVDTNLALPARVRKCLQLFKRPILFILSGRDLTADEFRGVIKTDDNWQHLLNSVHVSTTELPESDHTFSSKKWRDEVSQITLQWIQQLK